MSPSTSSRSLSPNETDDTENAFLAALLQRRT